jgi:hypothetical protein
MTTLSQCSRQYYYNYYLYTGGWSKDSDIRNRQAYRLKQLQNIFSITGTTVHETVKNILEGQLNPDGIIELQRVISSNVKKYYKDAKMSKSKFFEIPKQTHMLTEIYYDNDISTDNKQKINETVMNCSKTIFQSIDDIALIKKGKQILELDELRSFNFKNLFECYLKIDLLTRDNEGRYFITDWKTGKLNSENGEQLLLYAFYVSQKYGVPAKSIECRLCYLSTGDVVTYTFDEDDFERMEERLVLDYSRMHSYIKEGTKNTAIDEKYFEKSSHNCKNCNFREMCEYTNQ